MGDAYVDLHANRDGMKEDLQGAKADVEQTTAEMGDSAKRNIGGAFRHVGERIEKSTEGVRKFAGAITSTVGVATGLLGVFVSIRGMLALISKVTETIRDHYKDMASLSPKLTEQIERSAQLVRAQRRDTEVEAALRDKITKLAEEQERIEGGISAARTLDAAERVRALGVEIEGRTTRESLLRAIRETTSELKVQLADFTARLGAEQKALELEQRRLQVLKERVSAERELRDMPPFMPDLGAETFDDRVQRSLGSYRDAALAVEEELQRTRLDNIDAANKAWIDSLDPSARMAEEAAERFGERVAAAMSKSLRQQITTEAFAVPIEHLINRIEHRLDSLKHGGL
jgi:hypothetical protein